MLSTLLFSGTIVLIYWVWPSNKDASSWICAETMFYCMGPLLAAAISAPFMAPNMEKNTTELSKNNTLLLSRNESLLEHSTDSPEMVGNISYTNGQGHTDIPIAYGILSSMGVVSILLLIGVHFNMNHLTIKPIAQVARESTAVLNSAVQRHYSTTKIVLIIGVYLVYITHSIFTFSFGHFLVVFTVGHFNWPRSKGAFLATLYWIVNLFGKLIGIFIVRCIPNEAIFITAVIGVNVCLLGLVFTIDMSEVSIWVGTVLVSLCSTFCDPCSIIWIEKYIGMKGRVSAIPDVGVKSGDLLAAPLIGWLAQDFSYMFILYLVLVSAGLCLLLLTCIQLIGLHQLKTKDRLYAETKVELK